VDITFVIDEGTPSRVKTITIEGNTKTKDLVIRRELSLKPGHVFKQSAWERSIRDVYQLNFFKNIEQDRRVDERGDVDLILKVEERSTGTASMGAGFSGRDRLVGTVGFSIPNLMGNGQALDFNWEFGTRRKTFRLGFTEPWLLNSPTVGSINIFRQTRRFLDGFDYREEGGSVGVGRRVNWPDSYSHVSGSYRIERFKYFNFDDDYAGSYKQYDGRDSRIASLGLTYRRDSRDLPMFPTKGSRVSYTPEMAATWFGSTENYQKHLVDADLYVPTIWKFVFGAHARVGAIKGFAGTTFNDIPLLSQFTPGGVDFDGIIRGYADRSVGPRDESGAILGGNVMAVFNLEYQVPIVHQQAYGLLFADAGNAWRRVGDVDLRDLRKSVGFGIRVMAPMIGLIGFDFAYGFDQPKIDGGKAKWRTHFQFGPQFY
jgi:outer membrane protein insertion porin family